MTSSGTITSSTSSLSCYAAFTGSSLDMTASLPCISSSNPSSSLSNRKVTSIEDSKSSQANPSLYLSPFDMQTVSSVNTAVSSSSSSSSRSFWYGAPPQSAALSIMLTSAPSMPSSNPPFRVVSSNGSSGLPAAAQSASQFAASHFLPNSSASASSSQALAASVSASSLSDSMMASSVWQPPSGIGTSSSPLLESNPVLSSEFSSTTARKPITLRLHEPSHWNKPSSTITTVEVEENFRKDVESLGAREALRRLYKFTRENGDESILILDKSQKKWVAHGRALNDGSVIHEPVFNYLSLSISEVGELSNEDILIEYVKQPGRV
jgi:hypothetical protein